MVVLVCLKHALECFAGSCISLSNNGLFDGHVSKGIARSIDYCFNGGRIIADTNASESFICLVRRVTEEVLVIFWNVMSDHSSNRRFERVKFKGERRFAASFMEGVGLGVITHTSPFLLASFKIPLVCLLVFFLDGFGTSIPQEVEPDKQL